MTLTLLQIVAFSFASFVFVITPGPGVFAAIAKAMTKGSWAVLPLAIGMAFGDMVYMIFSVYGLSTLATNFHGLFTLIRFVGAAYLFYLAWKMWVAVPVSLDDKVVKEINKRERLSDLTSGFLISISNPKVILFYISLLPSFFPVTTLNQADTMVISAIVFVAVVLGIMLYAGVAGYAKKQLKNPKSSQRFNRVSATLMGGAGVWLLAKN